MHSDVAFSVLANSFVGITRSQLTSVFSRNRRTGRILYSQHNESHLTFVFDSCLFFRCHLDSEMLK